MSSSPDLPHPERAELSLTSVLFALSDPERLAIARQLVDGPLDMAECHLSNPDVPKSTKSHLWKVLHTAGVVRNEANGRARRVSLRREDLDARFPGLLDAVLSAEDGDPKS
jgi:DNA-binding transcriptional ArsR family regulator